MSKSLKHVRGVTLTPQERIWAGYAPSTTIQESSGGNLLKSHSCTVKLPDGSDCTISYTRYNARSHRFDFQSPLQERVWEDGRLDGGREAIECKARELLPKAFRQAQATEQKNLSRAAPPPGHRTTRNTEPQFRVKTARECGGMYAVCIRFPMGTLIPDSPLFTHPEQACRALQEQFPQGETLRVVGICNRWARRWQEPQFLCLTDQANPSSEPTERTEPAEQN